MWALNLTLKNEGYSDMYDPTVDPSIANHFSSAAFRFAHTLLPVSYIISVRSRNFLFSFGLLYNNLHRLCPHELYFTWKYLKW